MSSRPLSRATQVARALRELGFIDVALVQQRARRAYFKGESRPIYPRGREGWFRVYQDPRTHGRRVKIEVRLHDDMDKEELLKAEDAIRDIVPEATINMSPSETMLTIIWLEPTTLRARTRPPTHGLVG